MKQAMLEDTRLIELLQSEDPRHQRTAAEETSDFLHLRAHENGIARAILEPETVDPTDFTPQVDTDKPCIVRYMEPTSAGAVNLALDIGPANGYIGAPKYRVMFDRVASRRYTVDVIRLATYTSGLKELFNELILKDMLKREDVNAFSAIDAGIGSLNAGVDDNDNRLDKTGARGYITAGAYSRAALAHATNALSECDNALPLESCVINQSFLSNILAQDRQSIGGNTAEKLFMNGWTKMPLMGMTAIVTIKRDLVPNDAMYLFAPQKNIGDFLVVTDATMSFKKEDNILQFYGYEYLGQCWKNIAAMARVDFTGTSVDWRPADDES